MLNQMQKSITAIAVLAAMSLPAMANSVDVRVVGTITPSACTPTVSGNGTFNYGTIKPDTLSDTDFTVLAEKTLDLSISCDAPTKIGILVNSQRPDTAENIGGGTSTVATTPVPLFGMNASTSAFGLGLNGTNAIGGYGMRIVPSTSTADGASVDHITKNSTMTNWNKSPSGIMIARPDVKLVSSFAQAGTTTPMSLTTANAQIGIQAYINKKSELDVTKPVALDGLATIEMVYL